MHGAYFPGSGQTLTGWVDRWTECQAVCQACAEGSEQAVRLGLLRNITVNRKGSRPRQSRRAAGKPWLKAEQRHGGSFRVSEDLARLCPEG